MTRVLARMLGESRKHIGESWRTMWLSLGAFPGMLSGLTKSTKHPSRIPEAVWVKVPWLYSLHLGPK